MTEVKPAIYDIENAFQPAKEIDAADRFAGRAKPIQDAFLGLMAEGANIAIVGNRGIGKTSLARQIEHFGRGNNTLLKHLKLEYNHTYDYNVIYFACGNKISDQESLLIRLLTSDACLGNWLYDVPKTRKLMNGLSPKLTGKLKTIGVEFGGEIGASNTTEIQEERVSIPQTIEGIFENVLRYLVAENLTKDGILIVIDEFDQIDDPSGVGPFLKAIATNVKKVKFCIVGVAADIQELMKQHGSADRLFAGTIISLDPMSGSELNEIISIAEKEVNNYFKFTDEARAKIIGLAQGHPYLVHLIGKFAFRTANTDNIREIDTNTIDRVLSDIAENGSDPVLEGRYRKAVASSAQREHVLKSLAKTQDEKGEIWTTNAYKLALDAGVENSSQYVGQLVTSEFGAEIEKIRERYYRFKDSLFWAYVKARPPMRGLN